MRDSSSQTGMLCRCAGTCSYGNGAPVIKLSAPLMKYRTTEDMKASSTAADSLYTWIDMAYSLLT